MAGYITDESLRLAQNTISGTSVQHLHGVAPQITVSTLSSVWDVTDTVYPWASFDNILYTLAFADQPDDGDTQEISDGTTAITFEYDDGILLSTDTLSTVNSAAGLDSYTDDITITRRDGSSFTVDASGFTDATSVATFISAINDNASNYPNATDTFAALPEDGDTLTIDDGTNEYIFEYSSEEIDGTDTIDTLTGNDGAGITLANAFVVTFRDASERTYDLSDLNVATNTIDELIEEMNRARASITLSDNPTNAETVTIDDGDIVTVFEFDDDTITGATTLAALREANGIDTSNAFAVTFTDDTVRYYDISTLTGTDDIDALIAAIAAQRARIVFDDVPVDGDTITIDDGESNVVTFEFDDETISVDSTLESLINGTFANYDDFTITQLDDTTIAVEGSALVGTDTVQDLLDAINLHTENAATATVQFNGIPVDGDTISVNGTTFTFRRVITGAANEIDLSTASTIAAAVTKFIEAIESTVDDVTCISDEEDRPIVTLSYNGTDARTALSIAENSYRLTVTAWGGYVLAEISEDETTIVLTDYSTGEGSFDVSVVDMTDDLGISGTAVADTITGTDLTADLTSGNTAVVIGATVADTITNLITAIEASAVAATIGATNVAAGIISLIDTNTAVATAASLTVTSDNATGDDFAVLTLAINAATDGFDLSDAAGGDSDITVESNATTLDLGIDGAGSAETLNGDPVTVVLGNQKVLIGADAATTASNLNDAIAETFLSVDASIDGTTAEMLHIVHMSGEFAAYDITSDADSVIVPFSALTVSLNDDATGFTIVDPTEVGSVTTQLEIENNATTLDLGIAGIDGTNDYELTDDDTFVGRNVVVTLDNAGAFPVKIGATTEETVANLVAAINYVSTTDSLIETHTPILVSASVSSVDDSTALIVHDTQAESLVGLSIADTAGTTNDFSRVVAAINDATNGIDITDASTGSNLVVESTDITDMFGIAATANTTGEIAGSDVTPVLALGTNVAVQIGDDVEETISNLITAIAAEDLDVATVEKPTGTLVVTATAAQNIDIVLDSSDDVGCTLLIEGLDADLNVQTESIVVTATTGVSTVAGFKRIVSVTMTDHPAKTPNAGIIDLKIGTTVVAKIRLGHSSTHNATYTVPTDKTAYIKAIRVSVEADGDITLSVLSRELGKMFKIDRQFEVSAYGMQHTFDVPLVYAAGTDIDIQAYANAAARCTVSYDVILIND